MKNREIVIGSRESRLAVVQTEQVIRYIEENHPDIKVRLVTMETTGDKRLDVTLDKIGGKGLFVKELDRALIDGRIDLAVHSLKDMPMEESEEIPIVAYSPREDTRDVLVLSRGVDTWDGRGVVGCSSFRRRIQGERLYPEAEFQSIRGNVLTRLDKLDAGEYDALILAAAGLKRLGLEERIHKYFEVDEILPAAGQGIMAIQGRKGVDYSFLSDYVNLETAYIAKGERAFVRYLDGGCSSPVAAYGEVHDNIFCLRGLYYMEGTDDFVVGQMEGSVKEAEQIGIALAKSMEETYGRTASGKVFLVGAGPGDVGLLTVKGQSLLEQADVVVYDHLVGEDILARIDHSKKMINVGKIAGHHPIPQNQINRLLVEEAKKGNQVVRLKGGDPFLFGRGGEELEELSRENVPFEVVPGVTSSISVPAYNGIPVTHREYASSLHIVTGHKRAGQVDDINYKALVDAKGTIVFLMGVTALESIMEKLLAAGMNPQMPAAVLQEGTTAGQRRVVATVATLADKAKKSQIKPPAIIVVGKVCELSERLSWYEKMPLMGMRVLLTRPRELMSVTAGKLRDKGAEVLEIPAIHTVPIADNRKLESCLENISDYQWIVFTSQVGVRIFFEQLAVREVDSRKLGNVKFAVIGEGTRKALRQRGFLADLMPDVYDGESLAHTLARYGIEGQRILIPRAKKGTEELVPVLLGAGAVVDDVPIYETVYQEAGGVSIKDEIDRGRVDCVIFTSSSTVEGFVAASRGADYSKFVAACIGKQTAQTAGEYGMRCEVAAKATIDALVELVERIHGND